MSRRRWLVAALTGAAIVLVVGRALASLYVEYAWFASLGLPELGRASLAGSVYLGGGTTLLATLFLFANLYVVRRSVVSFVLPRRVGDLEFGEEVPGRYLAGAAVAIAVIVGSFLGLSADAWPHFAMALDDVRFGERDPYFGRDLGFFVGRLPAELQLFGWAQRVLLTTIVLVAGLYALTPSIRWRLRTLYVSEYVRRHLTVLCGVLLLLFAWGFRLEGFGLLFNGTGIGGAFGSVDLEVRVPGNLVLAAVALAAGLVVTWAGAAGQIRVAFLAVTVMLLLSVVVRYVLPPVLAPASERAAADVPFLMTRDNFTRRAFGGDRVGRIRAVAGDSGMHVAGAHGIALWDAAAILRAMDGAAGIGWSRDGDAVHALVAQRGFVDDGARTPWSITRIAAWTSDTDGSLPTTGATLPALHVLAPVIMVDSAPLYLALAEPDAVLRGTSASNWWSRLAHAWTVQNFRVLLGQQPGPEPAIFLRPGFAERVAAVVPFLVQGTGARPALAGDTLFWTVELYTASSSYPLSEPITLAGAERRYFHPAGHAIVNSATGLVRVAAVVDPEPPVVSWMERFPELFLDRDELPDGIRDALLPHPEVARGRAIAFARYGPSALDAPASRRHLAVEHGADSALAGGLVPLALVGRPGLTLAVPVLDERDRVRGIVTASGPDAMTRWIPVEGPSRLWAAVLDTLRMADSTRATHDSRTMRGRVRVIPLTAGFAFVQPTYLWPARGEPTLAAVHVLTDAGFASGRSAGIASDTRSSLPDARPPEPREIYLRMRDALRRGDWQAFGAAFDSLGRAFDAPAGKLPAGPRLDSLRAPQP